MLRKPELPRVGQGGRRPLLAHGIAHREVGDVGGCLEPDVHILERIQAETVIWAARNLKEFDANGLTKIT